MKTTPAVILPVNENWNGNKHKLKQLFTWVTGYDIIPGGSKEDISPEKMLEVLKSKTIVHTI